MNSNPVDDEAQATWHRIADLLRAQATSIIETHISFVALASDRVYKLKKPVRFDFVDLSTAEARHRAAEQEVILNRRLAANVYRGVVPVTRDLGGQFVIAGDGPAVEWLVEMRRLSDDLLLSHEIATGRVDVSRIVSLAKKLALFYATTRRISLKPGVLANRIEQHIADNRAELIKPEHGLDRDLIDRVFGRQLQFVTLQAELFDQRVAQGFVVDGHGDLRPEHICLESDPVIFDCLEFNDELREVDIADDLGFLAMECERLGAPWISDQIVAVYKTTCGDDWSDELFAFYRSYRAGVRAKVAVLSARDKSAESMAAMQALAEVYLRLADRSLGWTSKPVAVVFRGIVGSGKSTAASLFAQRLGAHMIQTDAVRRRLFGPSATPLAYGQGHYSDTGRARVYREALDAARAALDAGISVVLDGCFLAEGDVRRVVESLNETGVLPFVVHCVCSEHEILKRLELRAKDPERLSEATLEHFMVQRGLEQETPSDIAGMTLDTQACEQTLLAEPVIYALKRHILAGALKSPITGIFRELPVAQPCPGVGL